MPNVDIYTSESSKLGTNRSMLIVDSDTEKQDGNNGENESWPNEDWSNEN